MGKSTRTYEERIQEKDSKIERLMQELKQQEAQRKRPRTLKESLQKQKH